MEQQTEQKKKNFKTCTIQATGEGNTFKIKMSAVVPVAYLEKIFSSVEEGTFKSKIAAQSPTGNWKALPTKNPKYVHLLTESVVDTSELVTLMAKINSGDFKKKETLEVNEEEFNAF